MIPNPQEGDHEARSTLDIEFIDKPRTHHENDNSKNNLGAGEQEEEMQQPEIDISTTELLANVDPSPTSLARKKTSSADEDQQKEKSPEHTGTSPTKELKEPAMEYLYTVRSLVSTLSWGDQQIPEPVDEVVDIQEISYDKKRKAMMRRTIKKRKLTLDNTLLITTEETLFDTEMLR